MSVKMKPTSEIILDLGLESGGDVEYHAATRARERMNARYVPEDTGILKNTSFIEKDGDGIYIIYNQPYAHYMYMGKLYVMSNGKGAFYDEDYGFWSKKGEKKIPTKKDLHYTKPGTGPYWDKLMMSAEGEDLIKEIQEHIKKR